VFNLCLEVSGVELCEKLTSFHDRVKVRIKLLDLARNLATDLNSDHGLNDSRSVYNFAKRAGFYRCSTVLTRRVSLARGRESDGRDHDYKSDCYKRFLLCRWLHISVNTMNSVLGLPYLAKCYKH